VGFKLFVKKYFADGEFYSQLAEISIALILEFAGIILRRDGKNTSRF
jgi:hypothetical protein